MSASASLGGNPYISTIHNIHKYGQTASHWAQDVITMLNQRQYWIYVIEADSTSQQRHGPSV